MSPVQVHASFFVPGCGTVPLKTEAHFAEVEISALAYLAIVFTETCIYWAASWADTLDDVANFVKTTHLAHSLNVSWRPSVCEMNQLDRPKWDVINVPEKPTVPCPYRWHTSLASQGHPY